MVTAPKAQDTFYQPLKRKPSFEHLGTDPESYGAYFRSGTSGGAISDDDRYEAVSRKPARRAAGEQLELRAAGNASQIKAVVSAITSDIVTISCQLPNDNTDIEIPTGLLPSACAHYGAPVWVSVDTTGVVRRIKVDERLAEDVASIEMPGFVSEIDAWLAEDD